MVEAFDDGCQNHMCVIRLCCPTSETPEEAKRDGLVIVIISTYLSLIQSSSSLKITCFSSQIAVLAIPSHVSVLFFFSFGFVVVVFPNLSLLFNSRSVRNTLSRLVHSVTSVHFSSQSI